MPGTVLDAVHTIVNKTLKALLTFCCLFGPNNFVLKFELVATIETSRCFTQKYRYPRILGEKKI